MNQRILFLILILKRTLRTKTNLGCQHLRVGLQAVGVSAGVVTETDALQKMALKLGVEVGIEVVAC